MTGEWIGFASVVGPVILLIIFFWFRYRNRQETQQTIRMALDKGQELTPELIDRLGSPKPPHNKDLRLGIIWLAVGVAIAIFGQVLPDEEDAAMIMLGISAFPFCIGAAYLLIWQFARTPEERAG